MMMAIITAVVLLVLIYAILTGADSAHGSGKDRDGK